MTAPSSASPSASSDALAKLRIQRNAPQARKSPFKVFLKIILGLLLLLAFAAGLGYVALQRGWIEHEPQWLAVPEIMHSRQEVRRAVVSVEAGRAAEATVVGTGYLESRRQAKIGARTPGRLESVNVEEGSRVRGGELLAVLEHADIDASLAAIEASVVRAQAAIAEQDIVIQQTKRDWERAQRLLGGMGISEAEHDSARFAYEGAMARRESLVADKVLAEARVREQQQLKENMFIRAPFDGTVISKDAEVGESILPGGMGEASGRGSAVTVADLEHLEVDCDVKEDFIGRVSAEQTAEIAVDAVPDYRYRGRVRKIIPMGDRARATIKVKVEIVNADERLFPEMSATVYFLPPTDGEPPPENERRSKIWCDQAAVLESVDGPYVWIADADDRARRRPIETGSDRDGRVEITSGLTGEERVVIAPVPLQEGQRLKMAP